MDSTTETRPVATNQSVEKGIFLTPYNHLVHACKVREDLGVGITRCGVKFLIGNSLYISDATYGEAAKIGSDGKYKVCPTCETATGYEGQAGRWRDYKYVMRRTLKLIGRITS